MQPFSLNHENKLYIYNIIIQLTEGKGVHQQLLEGNEINNEKNVQSLEISEKNKKHTNYSYYGIDNDITKLYKID